VINCPATKMSKSYTIPVLPKKVICVNGTKTRVYERSIDFNCQTGGDGYWSDLCIEVNHRKIALFTLDSFIFELRVYFDNIQWNVDEVGLIYTDSHWIKDFKLNLSKLGFDKNATDCLEYSEQGMQGNDYVSLDVGRPALGFIKQYFDLLYKDKKKKLDSFSNLEILGF